MARPRRCGGNQPTTTRPLAELVLAAAATGQEQGQREERGCRPPRAASAPAAVVATRPVTSTKPLAAAVGHRAPRDQGEHHADGRGGGDQPGLRQGESLAVVQHGDQEGRPVHHHRGRRLRQRARREHRPAAGGAGLGRPPGGGADGGHGTSQRHRDAARRAPSCLLTCDGTASPRVSDPRRPGGRRTGRARPRALDGAMTTHPTPPPVPVGTGPLSFEDVLAVARDGAAGARSTPAAEAAHRAGPRRWSRSWPPRRRRRTASRPGSARWPPGTSRPRCARSCSGRWSARTPPAPVPRSSARWSAALMLLRLSTLATGHTGDPPRDRAAAGRPAHATGSRRWCASTARSAAPATWRRSSHCALALMGEGEVRDATGTLMPAAEALAAAGLDAGRAGRQGGPGADQRHRRHARHAGAGDRRPAPAAAHRRHRRGDVGRGPARHRPGLRPRAAGDPAAPRARRSRPPT